MTRSIRRTVKISELRPNNWFLNRAKLDRVRQAWRRGEQGSLPPVLVTEIGGQPSLIDGHARTYIAFENGASEIEAIVESLDEIEGSRALYEHIHREGPRIGVRHISDLAGRIVDPEEHRRLWIGYCEKWLAENEPPPCSMREGHP
jgi:ParB-like chromosome segregation protein Spo0J